MDNAAKIVSGVIKFIAPRISSAPYFVGYHIQSFHTFSLFSVPLGAGRYLSVATHRVIIRAAQTNNKSVVAL